jgi:hypothetical protein
MSHAYGLFNDCDPTVQHSAELSHYLLMIMCSDAIICTGCADENLNNLPGFQIPTGTVRR